MDNLTKLRRKHARQLGLGAVQAMRDSYNHTLVGNNESYTVSLRQTSYDCAHMAAERAVSNAVNAAKAAFNAHPELRAL